LSINNAGQVSGNSTYLPDDTNPNSNTLHVFLYSAGVMTDVGALLAGDTNSTSTGGLNDSGQITGAGFFDDQTQPHAFLYSGGVMKDLGTLVFEHSGPPSSDGIFINATGHVAGSSCCDATAITAGPNGFLYSSGVMQDLGEITPIFPSAGLNDAGQVCL
jgi:probable HAF family extracellular repeat protein